MEINKIVMQGENFAPLECSVQVDTYGKECMEQDKYLFHYREIVPVPALSMVDDLLLISQCGKDSVMINAFVNAKTNMKKLQFGEDKCHKIHVGTDKSLCPELKIEKWKEKEIHRVQTGQSSLTDVYDGKYIIKEKNQERYLGDIIDCMGRNDSNISKRVDKGHEKIKQVMGYLEDICFGKFHFTVAKTLRETYSYRVSF